MVEIRLYYNTVGYKINSIQERNIYFFKQQKQQNSRDAQKIKILDIKKPRTNIYRCKGLWFFSISIKFSVDVWFPRLGPNLVSFYHTSYIGQNLKCSLLSHFIKLFFFYWTCIPQLLNIYNTRINQLLYTTSQFLFI